MSNFSAQLVNIVIQVRGISSRGSIKVEQHNPFTNAPSRGREALPGGIFRTYALHHEPVTRWCAFKLRSYQRCQDRYHEVHPYQLYNASSPVMRDVFGTLVNGHPRSTRSHDPVRAK